MLLSVWYIGIILNTPLLYLCWCFETDFCISGNLILLICRDILVLKVCVDTTYTVKQLHLQITFTTLPAYTQIIIFCFVLFFFTWCCWFCASI